MRISVRHLTQYSYDQPIDYAIQTLRLAPRPHHGQSVLAWRVVGEGGKALPGFIDGLGNQVHCHSVNRPHREASVLVEGEVETRETHGVVAGACAPLPPAYFLRTTPLTAGDEALAALAHEARGKSRLDLLHDLTGRIRDGIDYQIGMTEACTPASEALAKGAGVCQDHAHVFIACARILGLPARYIGGYLWTDSPLEVLEAGHAWAEAYVEDLGWVGFDPANRVCATPAYVRVSVGLDYWSAAPVRGLWRGVGEEHLHVEVQVRQTQQ
ncbi:MAG: transglutaminase family protein [Alphaproteobacteria bacterium]|nr:MAG: transglutaminase family protein [Alphaproteobacteria bacterium]